MSEEVTIKIDDSMAADVCNSALAFLKFEKNDSKATSCGTGTLARLGGISGIITAGHVVKHLPTSGKVGLVRFQSIETLFQNFRLEMHYTDRVVSWNEVEGSAPDLAFLLMPEVDAKTIEAVGGVFYNLARQRSFSVTAPNHRMSKAYAVVGGIAEWSETVPGPRVGTVKKIVGGLFGAAQTVKDFKEGDSDLIEVKVDFASGVRTPKSYEGVSGGALWELHAELDGTKMVGIKKKLHGIAFRQSKDCDNHLIVCNGSVGIERLIDSALEKWPAGRAAT